MYARVDTLRSNPSYVWVGVAVCYVRILIKEEHENLRMDQDKQ